MFADPTAYQHSYTGRGFGRVLTARTSIYLWEFLLEILEDPRCSNIVRWTSKKLDGEFEFLDPQEVARQWGIVKRRPQMDKIKMCRAMRYYYKKGLLEKIKGRHFVYKFLQLPYNHPILTSTPATQITNPANTSVRNGDENMDENKKWNECVL